MKRRSFVGSMAASLTSAALFPLPAGRLNLHLEQQLANLPLSTVVPGTKVWLNANEYPEGPPRESIAALTSAVNVSNRYHYEEFESFYDLLAESFGLQPDNLLVGAGSSEALHCALEAFVNPNRPYITSWPSFEMGAVVSSAKGHPVIKIPLKSDYSADVESLVKAATRSNGALIYICNPNNPTSSLTSLRDIRWLVENLPPNTNVIIDEAYIHFTGLSERDTAVELVRSGKSVVVLRTFSKIYGMAGLRVGIALGPPSLISRMKPFCNNVISILGVRAVAAALRIGPRLVSERRAMIARTRDNFSSWCREKHIKYIEPHANFIMIETRRDVRQVIADLAARGVASGRPFPPYNTMLRITIGADIDMARLKTALAEVLLV